MTKINMPLPLGGLAVQLVEGPGPRLNVTPQEKTEGLAVGQKGQPLVRLTKRQLRNFWKKISASEHDGCWVWTASKAKGYGRFWVGATRFGAHRLMWAIKNGPISSGLFVCHHCDNPACVRPSHLFLATQKENVADMIRKERGNRPSGSGHHFAKLNDTLVAEIRALFNDGRKTVREISEMFGVTEQNIRTILQHKTWKHVSKQNQTGETDK